MGFGWTVGGSWWDWHGQDLAWNSTYVTIISHTIINRLNKEQNRNICNKNEG